MVAESRPLPLSAWAAMKYRPSGWALREVHQSTARFNGICTTRQCGKTTTGVGQLQDEATQPDHPLFGPPWVGVMSYDFEHAELLIDRWLDWVTEAYGESYVEVNRNKHTARLPHNGAKVTWHSSDNPRSLGGPTFSTLFVDEAQRVSDEAWNVVRPALNVRQARVFAFGTPDLAPDQTWFRGLWLRGQGGAEPSYHAHTVTCFENPWITLEEIRDARSTMTDDEFRMLMLGQWLDVDGRVFTRFEHCFVPDSFETYDPQLVAQGKAGPFIMGLDIAKERDFTVAYIFDLRRRQTVYRYRVSGLDYTQVEEQIATLANHWHVQYIHMDSTGVGNVVADALRRRNIPVIDFLFTLRSKAHLVSNLNRMLQHGMLRLDPNDTQLARELEVFQRKATPSGNVIFGHPVNFFDDCVMALGLCALKAREDGGDAQPDSYATLPGARRASLWDQVGEHMERVNAA